MIEVDRPDRKTRRFQGKSDPIDAIAAAKTALADERTGTPSTARAVSKRCVTCGWPAAAPSTSARCPTTDQGPDRHRPRRVTHPAARPGRQRADRRLRESAARPGRRRDPSTAARIALRSLARRHQQLSTEIADLDELLEPLMAAINPALLAGDVGADVASCSAACTGTPAPAYAERRTKEGLSKKEIIRCLKRYVARALNQLITSNDLELAA
ncbi:hypothetical protein [Paractinoplanes hotanensis]|uniref:Transposase n=1 Tax=Paractinoplanes hotanensis TaxID=2906497 RepID=A0ABT0YBY0_9ACTN|nr:hypothetical protein [Actinoplanes hotanensis]MCM4083549.1 hypothetical protein [Actinoplanes hotanensis]